MIINVRFIHPINSDEGYDAEIGTGLTAAIALEILHSPKTGPFLPALPPGRTEELVLQRNRNIIPKNTSVGQAGVVEGDVINVEFSGQGA